jgi:hypothetical protein
MKKCVETKLENSEISTDTDCPFCDTPCPNPECIYKEDNDKD